MAEDPLYVLEHNVPIDTQYYLTISSASHSCVCLVRFWRTHRHCSVRCLLFVVCCLFVRCCYSIHFSCVVLIFVCVLSLSIEGDHTRAVAKPTASTGTHMPQFL